MLRDKKIIICDSIRNIEVAHSMGFLCVKFQKCCQNLLILIEIIFIYLIFKDVFHFLSIFSNVKIRIECLKV